MADILSIDDVMWRKEPVGPDLSFEEIKALFDEVVRLGMRLDGYGRDIRMLTQPTPARRAMWAESLVQARDRWMDAIHRRFYFRGKPDEVAKLDAGKPTGGFSAFPWRRRRQQEVAELWARSLAIDFDAWVGHVQEIGGKPVAGLHDELWAIHETLVPVGLDSRKTRGYERAEAEMLNIIRVWSVVGGVESAVSFGDKLAVSILSETATRALPVSRLFELGAGDQRADIPGLLAVFRG